MAGSALALALTFTSQQSVFALVIMAWSGLASAFAPLLIVLCLGRRPSQSLSVIMVCTGIAVAVLWRAAGLHNAVYEGMPGILSGLLVYTALRKSGLDAAPDAGVAIKATQH